MGIIAPFSRWENPERYSVTCPRLYSLTLTELIFESSAAFILSYSYYKFIVSLNLLDYVCHFTYSKISAFKSRKGQDTGKSESGKMTKPCMWVVGGQGLLEIVIITKSQLQCSQGKNFHFPMTCSEATSFQLTDQPGIVSGNLLWHFGVTLYTAARKQLL